MFREDFTSPTGLIRRCLIYSLPQFPSPSIRCWDSPRRASRLLRAWFSKLSTRDANMHLSRSTWSFTCARLPLEPPAFWMQWCFCSWTAPQFSVPCNRKRNTKYVSHPFRRADLQETKKPTRNIQGTTTLWCSPGRQRQMKTFYPASVLQVNSYLCFQ